MKAPVRLEAKDRAHVARGSRTNFLTLAGQATMFGFGVLAARLFGSRSWGAYTTAYACVDILVRAALAGGDKSLLMFVAGRRARGDEPGVLRALATVLRLTLIVGGALVLAMVAGSWLVQRLSGDPIDGSAMRRLAPVVLTSALTTTLLTATMATKRFDQNLLVKGVAEPFLSLLLVVLLGIAWPRFGGLAAVPVLVGLATVALAARAAAREFDARQVLRGIASGKLEREVVRYGLPLAVAELVNVLVYRLDALLLIALASTEQRGVYNTCVILAATVSSLRGVFDTVVAPVAAEAVAQGDDHRLAAILQRCSRLVLVLAMPCGALGALAGSAMLGSFGPVFRSGGRTLAWLALGHVVNASFGLTGWVLMARSHTRTILVNNIVVLVVNTVLCLALIPRFGIEGAALATTTAIVLIQTVQVLQAWHYARVTPLSAGFVRLAAVGAAVTLAVFLAERLLRPSTAVSLAGGALAAAGCLLAGYLLEVRPHRGAKT